MFKSFFDQISVNFICFFKNKFTNSSFAETKTVSNKEKFLDKYFKIFTLGNLFKLTFDNSNLFNFLIS